MPTYEYECRACNHHFELFQSMSDAPVTVCPSCGGSVKRVIGGGTGVIFKGSGFYVTDSKKAANPAGPSAKSKEAVAKDAPSPGAAPCANCPSASKVSKKEPA